MKRSDKELIDSLPEHQKAFTWGLIRLIREHEKRCENALYEYYTEKLYAKIFREFVDEFAPKSSDEIVDQNIPNNI